MHSTDPDIQQTREWLDALANVIHFEGMGRAQHILEVLLAHINYSGSTAHGNIKRSYVNTLPVAQQAAYPGNLALENKLTAAIRWNAIAMVLRAKRDVGTLGGHLASYASIATLYEVGQHHFFRGRTDTQREDLVYFQGHSCEGNYARAFLEGRLSEEQLANFRQEVGGSGVSSYPHPWLMPHFWQFATVSLGLGPLQAIYQAQFLKYLENRQLLAATDRKVWVFVGDGEMDEPESIAGLTFAAREKLDNLIYVVNCNLQRLDGLVRSNSNIIVELENLFVGAGWNVIKVLWSSDWDPLFAKDSHGVLTRALSQCVDGQFQTFAARGGAYFREQFFGQDPHLAALVKDLSDQQIANLLRGGHDPVKVYAAYKAACEHKHQPTVILVHSVKGFGLGSAGESQNIAHNALDMDEAHLQDFRDRFALPIDAEALRQLAFYKPPEDSPEMRYLRERRQALGGFVPCRLASCESLTVPERSDFAKILQGSDGREMSSTMVLGLIINRLVKDPSLGKRIVPIFSDEVRTFGMEGLFRQLGIYAPHGQLYEPEDKKQLLYYREAKDGQLLEQGITEAGCMASWLAAATSYSTHQLPMVPIFTFYSMFGFQRVGDFIWAAADMRARGFLIGATAGRTTLAGEGLQHQDGHSLLAAAAVPNCIAYDPAFGYEMAVIMQEGLRRMLTQQEDVFYYITAMNEKYVHPPMPHGVEEGILKGMYLFSESDQQAPLKVQLLGSGAILNEVIAAKALLEQDFGVFADVWSATSFNQLYRDASALARAQMLEPSTAAQQTYLEELFSARRGPMIAATDYCRSYAEQIRPFVRKNYFVLGTDGFGRSDSRPRLRQFFEVDRYYIVVAALHMLSVEKMVDRQLVDRAIEKYGINPHKPHPAQV